MLLSTSWRYPQDSNLPRNSQELIKSELPPKSDSLAPEKLNPSSTTEGFSKQQLHPGLTHNDSLRLQDLHIPRIRTKLQGFCRFPSCKTTHGSLRRCLAFSKFQELCIRWRESPQSPSGSASKRKTKHAASPKCRFVTLERRCNDLWWRLCTDKLALRSAAQGHVGQTAEVLPGPGSHHNELSNSQWIETFELVPFGSKVWLILIQMEMGDQLAKTCAGKHARKSHSVRVLYVYQATWFRHTSN